MCTQGCGRLISREKPERCSVTNQTLTVGGKKEEEREAGIEWNNLIRQQHVEHCRSERSGGRRGTLNLERDCEIVHPHPSFPSRVVMQGETKRGRDEESAGKASKCKGRRKKSLN